MCWDLHFADDNNKIVEEIVTTKQAIERFGAENIRFWDGSPVDESADNDHCLCPVDIEYLLDRVGWQLVEHPHPLWDSFNNVAIKKAPPSARTTG